MGGLELEFVLQKLAVTEIFDLSEIDVLQEQLKKHQNPNFAALEHQRLQGSNTLLHQKDIDSWQSANKTIFAWVINSEPLSFPHLIAINQILHPTGDGNFRNSAIFAALGEFVDCKLLGKFEQLFTDMVLQPQHHPIYQAALAYQWISTFHPFTDANGRTARLAADFILLSANYVPLSFENPFDAMVAINSRTSHINGNYGIQKILKGLKNSYHTYPAFAGFFT